MSARLGACWPCTTARPHCWPRHPDERFDGYLLLANLLANRWVTTVEVMATACCCCLLACLGTRICHGRCIAAAALVVASSRSQSLDEPRSQVNTYRARFHSTAFRYHCPVTFKVFNENSKITAVKTSGNVYSQEAIDTLNVKVTTTTTTTTTTTRRCTCIRALRDKPIHNVVALL